MRAYTIQEPTVVADHHGTTGKILQSFLQRTQGVHVDIVGRLVQQQHVGFAFQRQRQMQTVPLATTQHTAFLLLVSTCKIEPTQIRSRVNLLAAYTDKLGSATDGFKHRLVRVDVGMLLVHITYFHGLADAERTFVGFLRTDDHAEQGCLAGAVRTDHTHNAVRRQHEIQIFEQQTVTKTLCYAFGVNHLVAQTRTVGNKYLQTLLFGFLLFVQHLVVGIQTGFLLGVTGLGSHMYPFQLAFQGFAALAGLFLFLRHTGGFLFQPTRVVTFPRYTLTAVQFQYPTGYIIEEIPIVGDTDHRTGILLQVLFQPIDTLGIQMVGRLVQ